MPSSNAAWQQKLAALRAYAAAHGRLPPQGDASGLGKWLHQQREAKRALAAGRKSNTKMTPQRAAALEAVPGWAWEVDAEALWQEKLAALRAYVGAHGRLPPQSDASGLGAWINNQRQAKKAGPKCRHKMTPQRTAALEGVPGWAWDPHDAIWQERLDALRAYVAARGRLPMRGKASGLGEWVNSQRKAKKAADGGRNDRGGMPPARVAALEAVPGWAWEVNAEAAWQDNLAALQAYVAAHGRLPPKSHPSRLGKWVESQRTAKKAMEAGRSDRGAMTPQRVATLEAVPGWTWDGRHRAAAPAAAPPAKRAKKACL